MASYPTPDIVTALAPDASSLKAGRGLSSPGKWTLAAGNEEALWGLMQGSGKDPYQVQVLADGSATKCSCPSRKFPCKHALGLLFIAAEQPGKLASSEPPAWVGEWLASRSEKSAKAEAKAVRTAEAGPKPADEKAQAKRREKRAERVSEGIAFLRQWLGDLIKQGLADAPLTDHSFWENTARRMVDAQAPGLARLLRLAGETARRGAEAEEDREKGGASRLPDDLGRLHLLLTAGSRLETLEPDLRAEVEQLLGWTVPQESVLAGAGLTDRWFAAARTMEEEERVITAVTWLYGAESGRHAMWIQSAPAQQPVFTPVPVGRWVGGELAFYPGAEPLRALWKTPFPTVDGPPGGPAAETASQVLERYARSLAANPWRTRQPFYMRARTVSENGEDWLVDETGQGLPMDLTEPRRQLMAAVSGGRAGIIFGLWDGYGATPLGMEDPDAETSAWIPLTEGHTA